MAYNRGARDSCRPHVVVSPNSTRKVHAGSWHAGETFGYTSAWASSPLTSAQYIVSVARLRFLPRSFP